MANKEHVGKAGPRWDGGRDAMQPEVVSERVKRGKGNGAMQWPGKIWVSAEHGVQGGCGWVGLRGRNASVLCKYICGDQFNDDSQEHGCSRVCAP